MANNIPFFRGGMPKERFIWNEHDVPEFSAPFSNLNYENTPPYDSHADGAYNLGAFVLGMPINPNGAGMTWQRKLLERVTKDDIIQCIWLPEDHFATDLNLKSVTSDEHMAGATLGLVTQTLQYDANGDFTITEDSFLAAAMTAQGVSNVIALDEPFNIRVGLQKVQGGYVQPLYSKPSLPAKNAASSPVFGKYYIFGLKVLSMPTATATTQFNLAQMQKNLYMSVRMQAFECPTNY